ncbi:MAG TPA: helix-turn-helix domain-containing protein, partial [Ktedonobacterales bacterium]|nr:helix-turn-helix domain-containing protein [Ktedonobacterales bacterium]
MTADQSSPFGELLRRYRQAAGLTQSELAERAGLSWRGINDLERGVRRQPRRDTTARLAEALRLTDAERDAFFATARHPAIGATALHATAPDAGALPAGTVTFLFTDIEGSTRLLQQQGSARYAALRAEHQALLRAAAVAHGGHEVDSQG